MKVDLYARVSTGHQDVEQQMKALRKWAVSNGHKITNDVTDKESGTKPLTDRKQFKELLDNPRGDALVVFNLDRLSRHWHDEPFIEDYFIDKKGVYELLSLNDSVDLFTANGRMMFRIKFAVNCQMPEDMKIKQKPGIARAKAEGKFKGGKKGRTWKKTGGQKSAQYQRGMAALKRLRERS